MAKYKAKAIKIGNSLYVIVPNNVRKYDNITDKSIVDVDINPVAINPNSSDNSLYTFPLSLDIAEVS